MIAAVLSEFIGTFVFLLVILVVGQPIPIVIGLLAVIFAFGNISGGHMNPAVSTMMLAKGDIDVMTYILYVIAQVLGGLAALLWWSLTNKVSK
jgi:glycerol uptake facilitator-like aquaporin